MRRRLSAIGLLTMVAALLTGCLGIGLPQRFVEPQTKGPYTVQDGKRFAILADADVPKRFSIWHDEFEAEYVGKTSDGHQFFVGDDTSGDFRRGYLVLFLWDADGAFESASVADLGTEQNDATRSAARSKFLKALGTYRIANIRVEPFGVTAFGDEVGFIPKRFDGSLSIELLPANTMAFNPPWTYGHYDT